MGFLQVNLGSSFFLLSFLFAFVLFNENALASISPSQQNDILNAHNEARRNVNPPAVSQIPDLVWDSNAAIVAQQWAGKFIHFF